VQRRNSERREKQFLSSLRVGLSNLLKTNARERKTKSELGEMALLVP
jgi:hypothetical protein